MSETRHDVHFWVLFYKRAPDKGNQLEPGLYFPDIVETFDPRRAPRNKRSKALSHEVPGQPGRDSKRDLTRTPGWTGDGTGHRPPACTQTEPEPRSCRPPRSQGGAPLCSGKTSWLFSGKDLIRPILAPPHF